MDNVVTGAALLGLFINKITGFCLPLCCIKLKHTIHISHDNNKLLAAYPLEWRKMVAKVLPIT